MSKALLGHKHRMAVAAAIAQEGGATFSAMSLSENYGLSYPRVHEQLTHLLNVNMITRVGSTGREVEYKAAASVYWEMCRQLQDEVILSSE